MESSNCHARMLQANIQNAIAPGEAHANAGEEIQAFMGYWPGSGAILATQHPLRTGVDKKMTRSVFLTNIEEYELWRALRTRLRNQPKRS